MIQPEPRPGRIRPIVCSLEKIPVTLKNEMEDIRYFRLKTPVSRIKTHPAAYCFFHRRVVI